MTKELVEEAIGRPPKEREVINEVKKVLREIKSTRKTIVEYENMIKHRQKGLEVYKHNLELLRQGKYALKKSAWHDTGFEVEYEEE